MKKKKALAIKKKMATALNIVLASETLLYNKTRKAYWNAYGEHFAVLHKLYEEQYRLLEISADDLSERISLCNYGIMKIPPEHLNISIVKKDLDTTVNKKETVRGLCADHEKLTIELKSCIAYFSKQNNDMGTTTFLSQLLAKHQTMAAVLTKHLK